MPPTPYRGYIGIVGIYINMKNTFCYVFFVICFAKYELNGVKTYLKSILDAVRFILTEYGPVASHGDPIRDQNCFLG